ncbi:MAG: hypothetical protein JNK82_26425, partial [Myxococcaceae bacterium]|nr:hypothetical protein [Myxococcaceae bacterium]
VELSPAGQPRKLLTLPGRRTGHAAAVFAAGRVWAIAGKKLVGVTPAGAPIELTHDAKSPELLAGGDRLLVLATVEETAGPRTRVLAVESGAPRLRELFTVPAEIFAARSAASAGTLVAVTPGEDDGPSQCLAYALDAPTEPVRFTTPRQPWATAHGPLAAIDQGTALALFAVRDGRVCCLRLPLPEGSAPSVGLGEGRAVAVVSQQLIVLDTAALTFTPGVSASGLDAAPLVPPSTGDPVPATVVFDGASLVSVDHPRLGRLNLKRTSPTPALAANDRVVLDAITESMPGVWSVDAWHRQGDPAPAPSTGPLTLSASQLPPLFHAPSAQPRDNLPRLRDAAARLGFTIPPLLEKLLAEYDKDPTVRRWLEQLSLFVEVTGFTTAWEGSDPCLLGLAGNGGGDVVSLYVYPPAHPPGAELPVVDWWHETNEVTWLASGFEAWWRAKLNEERKGSPEVVTLLLERLGLAADFPRAVEAVAPDWLATSHGTADEKAERALVGRLVDDPEDDTARAQLAAVYERLGWAWHRENLDRT